MQLLQHSSMKIAQEVGTYLKKEIIKLTKKKSECGVNFFIFKSQ